ncbi:unnamed protein product [Rhodiola kirilowii]
MEHLSSMYEGEWSCLSKMYTTTEESDFMAQLLGGLNSASSPYDKPPVANQPRFWLKNEPRPATDNAARNFVYGGSLVSDSADPDEPSSSFLTHETCIFLGSGQERCCDQEGHGGRALGTDDMISKLCYDDVMQTNECLDQSMVDCDMKAEAECGANLSLSVASDHKMREIRVLGNSTEDKYLSPIKISGKKSRKEADVKIKRNVKQRKNKKAESISSDVYEDGTWGANTSQSSSLTCSENENNASHGGESSSSHKVQPALNLNGRTRAGRGSATDPQSLYARKRRERINERLKTLQSLVPNGTKVDISTMLEEAVQYVKFLQLQIKLLSSDDMWMYAPLAYSGMDIGLFDCKNTTTYPNKDTVA